MSFNDLSVRRGAWSWRVNPPVVAFFAAFLALLPGRAAAPAPFATFLGQGAAIQAIGHDLAGNIFTVWNVPSQPTGSGSTIAVAKFDPDATEAIYFVYVGSTGHDTASAMAVDSQGDVYLTGASGASGFAAKLDPNGAVVYYKVTAPLVAIAVDSAGDAIVSGFGSGLAASAGAFSVSYASTEPFVMKLDPTGAKILFTALGVGGSRIAVGPGGDIFLAGNTTSTSYPTTTGVLQTTFKPSLMCGSEGFCITASEQYVTRLSADGSKLVYSTFLTGSGGASNYGLAVDSSGNAYVTGTTTSQDFPYTATYPADRPGLFLAKLDPTGSKLVWSLAQGGTALALDSNGNPLVGGSFVPTTRPISYTPGTVFPPPPPTGTTPDACVPNGTTVQSAAYVQSFSALDGSTTATRLLSGTNVTTDALTIEPDGSVLLAGWTAFPDVPLSPGVLFSNAAAQRTAAGGFLAAFDLSQAPAGPQLGCALDSATMMPVGPVAPGQLISLFGAGLKPAGGGTAIPASLMVSFDNAAATVLYASDGQVNVQVPYAVSNQGSTVMTVSINGLPALSRMFAVTTLSPSVFLDLSVSPASCGALPDGSNVFAAVALNSDGSRNSCGNPAAPGSVVSLFLNGVPPPDAGGVEVSSGTLSLAAGPLAAVAAGVYGLPVQLTKTGVAGSSAIELQVGVDGVAAAPFTLSGGAYQTPVLVWMKQ